MQIYIQDLMKIQNELDTRIFTIHQTSRSQTRNDRILALLVEVGELANETRCFKYWSTKKASADEVIFEEFSDVVHFALSLGIDLDFKDEEVHFEKSSLSLNDQFHRVYACIHQFSKSQEKEDYVHMMQTIFTLADSLGLDAEGIRERYLLKNKKNHQRQDDHY